MIDKQKVQKLAEIIAGYSIDVQAGEKVLIRGYGFDGLPLIKEIYRECLKRGAIKVEVRFSHEELAKIFFDTAVGEQLTYLSDLDQQVAENFDAMVQIVADQNPYELADVDTEKLVKMQTAMKPLSEIMLQKKWCLFYYPNLSSAQTAKRSLEEWENFVLDSCIRDWRAEEAKQLKFVEVMKKVDRVKIKGIETDLELSVKGQNWRTCCGKRNLPDGEIFTAPLKNSVSGVVRYNVPTRYQSQDFNWVKLWLENGKVVKEESDNLEALQKILATDAGARYFGEFAFGLNDSIQKGTRQIIFDEKMGKSLHMALGRCYKECPNGNDSNIHWDLILRFKEAQAQIWFDEVKVFEDGKWILEELLFLN